MKTKFKFIPIDYDYVDWQGKNHIKIIGRTDKGRRACIIDSFEPHFWAIFKPNTADKKIQEIQEKINKIKIISPSRTTKVTKTEIHNKNFLGKPVKAIKIFTSNWKDAHAIADKIPFEEIDKRREYDINLITKYIIEKNLLPLTWYEIEGELLNNSHEFGGIDSVFDFDTIKLEKIAETKQIPFEPKILAYDIEVDELEIGKGEILMISLVGKNFKKVLTWKNCSIKQDFVEYFKDEAEMLEAFVKYIKEQAPDILAGYFSDSFDLPYLRARAEKNKIKLNIGIDNSQPKFSGGRIPTGKISGIIHIDLLTFIRVNYSQYLQSETLSLNEVASELLGEKKLDFNHQHSSKLNEKEWNNYFSYNLQDSLLTYKLAEKALPDLIEFTKIIQEPLFNVSRESMSVHVENYIIHNLNKFNEIAEKHPVHEEIKKRRAREKYEGAFVLQPEPGLYENLAMFDFTSMYASVIVTYNLSLSTIQEKKQNSHEIKLKDKTAYFSKKQGFFPSMLNEIIIKRKQYKSEYNSSPSPITKARSNAYKLLANAAYGYQGFFGARYYCREAAASTAAMAKQNILQVIEKIKKQGYKVIYSDTDSIAFILENKTQKQTLDFLKKLNSQLPGIMELDLEDFYKRGIWVTKRTGEFGAKKKYALISYKGKIKIRGFETVRRDWCNLARELQSTIIKTILKDGNEKSALEYLKKIIKELKERKITQDKIIIKTQLKKPISEYKAISPHVIGARKMQEQEIPVSQGTLIEYFIAETKSGSKKSLVREKVKLPHEKGKYNIKYYLNHQLIPAVENIFQVFNINAQEIADNKKQMKLVEF